MKIASMVPSWTETLLEAGADVVARTRFCRHPVDRVRNIAAVGGTKDIDWRLLRQTEAELLLLDREENPRSMAEDSPIPYLATHIRAVEDIVVELERIAGCFEGSNSKVSNNLRTLAERWNTVIAMYRADSQSRKWSDLPGILEWISAPVRMDEPISEKTRIIYMIWRTPWMAAGPTTFIGSVLDLLGFGAFQFVSEKPYPEINLADLNPAADVLLFSSEPFPFHRKKVELAQLGFRSALVDGEAFSWFGCRSLRFLEENWARRTASTRNRK